MVVVSDTTPIITLLKLNELRLLKDLFGKVYIPNDVYSELVIDEKFKDEARKIREAEYIVVETIDSNDVEKLMRETTLDRGESAAICLYEVKSEEKMLLIDERKGRKIAKERNIKIIGTIGLLALAFKSYIRTKEEIINIVKQIKEQRKFYSEDLLSTLLDIIQK